MKQLELTEIPAEPPAYDWERSEIAELRQEYEALKKLPRFEIRVCEYEIRRLKMKLFWLKRKLEKLVTPLCHYKPWKPENPEIFELNKEYILAERSIQTFEMMIAENMRAAYLEELLK